MHDVAFSALEQMLDFNIGYNKYIFRDVIEFCTLNNNQVMYNLAHNTAITQSMHLDVYHGELGVVLCFS